MTATFRLLGQVFDDNSIMLDQHVDLTTVTALTLDTTLAALTAGTSIASVTATVSSTILNQNFANLETTLNSILSILQGNATLDN
jgi:phospholipid N-methyltransferase